MSRYKKKSRDKIIKELLKSSKSVRICPNTGAVVITKFNSYLNRYLRNDNSRLISPCEICVFGKESESNDCSSLRVKCRDGICISKNMSLFIAKFIKRQRHGR